jgi:hypothetical protein
LNAIGFGGTFGAGGFVRPPMTGAGATSNPEAMSDSTVMHITMTLAIAVISNLNRQRSSLVVSAVLEVVDMGGTKSKVGANGFHLVLQRPHPRSQKRFMARGP